jgi:CxxC motif-containing protein (DUF1111 family)
MMAHRSNWAMPSAVTGGEAEEVTEHFSKLRPAEKKAVLTFLQSL